MILTSTPLRISLVGGGSDLPAFYKRSYGAVVSFGINKYVYVGINSKFDGKMRVSYSRTENVNHPMEVKHDIIREALLSYGVDGVEVVTVADIPGTGTGLGSSSALAVGMTRAIHRFRNDKNSQHPAVYAEHAYHLEREMCQHSVGKQDHYASAYGGLHYYQFNMDDSVTAELIDLNDYEKQELENRFVLLWTGRARSATDILKAQEANMATERFRLAMEMRDLAVQLRDDLRKKDFSNIGPYLNINWQLKRQLATGITDTWIDQTYQRAISAGAQGGKICGAGGGGFFLFYGEFGLGATLEAATGLKRIPFEIEKEGCKVIYA